jgi:hypothetical protein
MLKIWKQIRLHVHHDCSVCFKAEFNLRKSLSVIVILYFTITDLSRSQICLLEIVPYNEDSTKIFCMNVLSLDT